MKRALYEQHTDGFILPSLFFSVHFRCIKVGNYEPGCIKAFNFFLVPYFLSYVHIMNVCLLYMYIVYIREKGHFVEYREGGGGGGGNLLNYKRVGLVEVQRGGSLNRKKAKK